MYYLPIVLMAIDGFTCMEVIVSISIEAMSHSGAQCALHILHKETLHLFSMCHNLSVCAAANMSYVYVPIQRPACQ